MKGIKPGQIPDWRPGAVYWKPIADGREVTIYPLNYGKARLSVGPLADPHGYDVAYRYSSIDKASAAAEAWDPEKEDEPAGYEAIDFSPKAHKKAPVHSDGIQVGQKIELNDAMKQNFVIEEVREMGGQQTVYLIEGITEDGFPIRIEAQRKLGDPVGNSGDPLMTVTGVEVDRGTTA